MAGKAALDMRQTPMRLVFITLAQISSVVSCSSENTGLTAALHTTTSRRQNRSSVASTGRVMSSALPTCAGVAKTS